MIHRRQNVLLLLFAYLVAGGVTAAKTVIEVDADQTTDFSAYATFAVEFGTPPRSERAFKEIAAAVTDAVSKRGLRPVASAPDLRVRVYVLVDAHSLEELADESQWEFWTGVRNISAYDLGEGTLVIDFVDGSDGRIVWRGLTTERLGGSAQSNYDRLPKIVGRVVKRYPKR